MLPSYSQEFLNDGALHDKRDVADVIKARILREGGLILDDLGDPSVIRRVLRRENQRELCQRKRSAEGSKGRSDVIKKPGAKECRWPLKARKGNKWIPP